MVGLGENVSYKYLACIKTAVQRGEIDGYSIIELVSQKSEVLRRLASAVIQPKQIFYLPKPKKAWVSESDFAPVIQELVQRNGRIKVYIATEVKAHEAYLTYCVENGIDSLTEKPLIAPMKRGRFNPAAIEGVMQRIARAAQLKPAHHSVMTLGRYDKVYNDVVLESVKKKMVRLQAPLTSIHMRFAGGVWNLHREYESREDHPYKYGYGMLMHGSYHYVDLLAQFLCLNQLIFPKTPFSLSLSSFAAYPIDQNDRIPRKFGEQFDDYEPNWPSKDIKSIAYGETDIVTSFCLRNEKTGKIITLGTISLEQTTPSIRSWINLPAGHNKNGRVCSFDLEVQLATMHAVHVECFDVPILKNKKIQEINTCARVVTRSNAALLPSEEFTSEQIYTGISHRDNNRKLLSLWLQDKEYKSQLLTHVLSMRIVQAIALSIKRPGVPLTINFI